jgi:hypothetical protein
MKSTLSRSISAAPARTMLLATVLSLASMPAFAQARLERPSDREVKALIDQVDEGRDKFEGNLDGGFKGTTIKGPNGETKVQGALQDYQDNTKKLKERFTAEYSAAAEVATILKQSMAIAAFLEGQPTTMKGRSEWDRQVAILKRLAEAYGTTFPFPAGATPARINDKETAAAAEATADAAKAFKNDIDKDATLAKPDKDATKKDVDALIKLADTVKSRTNDGKPATAEVRHLVEQAARLETFAAAHPAITTWPPVRESLGKLQKAFGLTP